MPASTKQERVSDMGGLHLNLQRMLESKTLWLIARLLLCVVFVSSGLAKLIDFNCGVAEMAQAGLEPAAFYNVVVALTLLGGSVLLLTGHFVWLGAGVLGVFLFLTILVVHRFWALPEQQAKIALFWALEHISVIGGLMAAAIAGHFHSLLDRAWQDKHDR